MYKIFFAIFFISELIIATAIVLKLVQLRKCVNSLNDDVLYFQKKIEPFFIDVRLFLEDILHCVNNFKIYIVQKRREYVLKALNNAIVYLVLLLLKGKYKKAVIAYLVGKDICEGLLESVF